MFEEEQIHERLKMEKPIDVQGLWCPNTAVDLAYMLKMTCKLSWAHNTIFRLSSYKLFG